MSDRAFLGIVGLIVFVITIAGSGLTAYAISRKKDRDCEKALREQREYYTDFILGKKMSLPGDTLTLIIK